MSQKVKSKYSDNSNSCNYYKNFINSCKSEATKHNYVKGLCYFMDYLHIEHEEDCYSKLIDDRDFLAYAQKLKSL